MKYQFNNCQELVEICERDKIVISEVAIRREMELFNKSRPWVRNKMKEARNTMWEAIQKGLKSTKKSKFGLVGTSAAKMYKGVKKSGDMLHSKVAIRAMAYAIATNEQNARMGKIVAFPTAGGAGVIPAVLFSTYQHMKSSKRRMLHALFTASAIGIAILKHGGTFSAARGGCQAEVGVGTAMAAAAVTEMRGGTPAQCVNAAALALKNMLGLACDPLAGLVEVPCVKRNAIAVTSAISASDMSMLGINSFVPMDEVVEAMMNISATMHESIRETALGGLATTPTGLKIREKMGLPKVPKAYLNRCQGCKSCN